MIEIQLPWPPSALSPNARTHWAAFAKEKKKFRNLCDIITLDQIGVGVTLDDDDAGYVLDLEFFRPTMRSYDADNLMFRMKSGIDGMCDALSINDKRFCRVTSSISQSAIGGFAKAKIYKIGVSNGD